MDHLFDNTLWLIIIGILGYFAYGVARNKGLRGMLFGAQIIKTLGEVDGKKRRGLRASLKVHLLKEVESVEKAVGLEFVAKSFLSYQMMPICLSAAQARKLAILLNSATAAE
jgi:hypothetical protein